MEPRGDLVHGPNHQGVGPGQHGGGRLPAVQTAQPDHGDPALRDPGGGRHQAGWTLLIGPDPSRHCALIGGDHSVVRVASMQGKDLL